MFKKSVPDLYEKILRILEKSEAYTSTSKSLKKGEIEKLLGCKADSVKVATSLNHLRNSLFINVNHNVSEGHIYSINLKGLLYLQDQKKFSQTRLLSKAAILISVVSVFITAFFSYKDYQGDKVWQNEQLKELQILNENLERLNIEDPETSSG